MKNQVAIKANKISKTFHISEDSHNTVKHRLFNLFNPPRNKNVAALKEMDFEVNNGECIGLLGRNGSGKSTLVKVFAGVYHSDSGSIDINETTMLMILGRGLSPECTVS